MKQYINKSAVITEIERLIASFDKCQKITDTQIAVLAGNRTVLLKLLSFIDTLETLEVKDVDLEKEFDDYVEKQNAFIDNDNNEIKYYNGDSFDHVYDVYPIAKHFYELGLKHAKIEE